MLAIEKKIVLDKKVYIILGSNIGDKKNYIDNACIEISDSIGNIETYSSYYQTSPWGFESNDEFLNRVICVNSKLYPNEIMSLLLEIENRLGRVRHSIGKGYQSRTIDLDILLIDDLIINNESLIVPHPRMTERRFVLVPLSEIAGDFIHPQTRRSINHLLNICKDVEAVTKVL